MRVSKRKFNRDSFADAVGAEIADLRRQKFWSGKQLGRLIGVSQQQISRYENGVCEITTSTLCALLHHLEISLSLFFYRVALRLEKNQSAVYADFGTLFEKLGPHSERDTSLDIYAHF
ncbi:MULTISPECIES: helix-turn-helix domain-containing protein [Providencia]|uniref:Helix-turn-helix transcriptional regulator n=1 Tax=Providencia rettgeri TaxID=587 RepID=A0AAJ6JXE3_PRORE|nr:MULTISPECIES: helix-turn-helix transcriptional regulator [Providencia]WHT81636.1 helix-turn-helix transcriptional regulator [Providencia rettgeri]WHT95744.1 helix-turn-helix transcriptional regulator [Providencia rettgeri]WJM88394.1 helix-turn-helix transcriptional regulator [Providencia rettgeri]